MQPCTYLVESTLLSYLPRTVHTKICGSLSYATPILQSHVQGLRPTFPFRNSVYLLLSVSLQYRNTRANERDERIGETTELRQT